MLTCTKHCGGFCRISISSIDPLGLQFFAFPGMGAGTAERASLIAHMTMRGASSEEISRAVYGDTSGGFLGSIADKVAEGGQFIPSLGGTLAFGVGLSGQAGSTTDLSNGLTCATTTVCGIVGPIIGGSSNIGYTFQTGKVTPGDTSWSVGGVGTWTVGAGGLAELSLGADGSVGVSGGKSIGLLLGGGLQICRQATSTKCGNIAP